MNSTDYNFYYRAINSAKQIKDNTTKRKALDEIKTSIIAKHGINDKEAKYLIKLC